VVLLCSTGIGACTSNTTHVVAGGGTTTISASSTTTVVTSATTVATSSTTTGAPPSTVPPTQVVEQTTTTVVAPVAEPLPVDSAVRTGSLDNGLRYYIRSNNRPGAQVSLRLAINAGSVDEDPDQSGVAHFLEHMMFNGTTKYPKNDLVAALKDLGVEFGADLNAYTSFDETVYQLAVPNKPSSVATGLDILDQWLTAATLRQDDVSGERGVVLDEWRSRGQSAQGRAAQRLQELLLGGSSYAGRQPIGDEAAINAMTSQLVKRFYDAWYRPDNAAVIVVGDIDVAAMESQLRKLFTSASGHGTANRKPVSWAAPTGPRAAIFEDPDITDASVDLWIPNKSAGPDNSLTVLQDLQDGLAFRVIANRLSDDVRRGKASFTGAQMSDGGLARLLSAPGIHVDATHDTVDAAYSALVDEFARVAQFGFSASEVDRAVAELRSAVEDNHNSSSTTQDPQYAEQYVANFLSGRSMMNANDEYHLRTSILDSVTVADVTAAFNRSLASTRPMVMMSTGAATTTSAHPSIDQITTDLGGLATRHVTPREDDKVTAKVLIAKPSYTDNGTVTRLTSSPSWYLKPTMLTFANGVRVVLNSDPIVKDTVTIRAVSPGGIAMPADADVAELWLLNEVVTESGFGDLDAVQVGKILESSSVRLAPYPAATQDLFAGSAGTKDLELAFQELNQYFAAARFTDAALKTALDRDRAEAQDPNADADRAIGTALDDARYGDNPRFRQSLTVAEFDSINIADMRRVWNERFGNAGDFVFILSGDFSLDDATDFARAYLGTLSTTTAHDQRVSVRPDPPAGVVSQEIHAGTGDKGSLTLQYSEPAKGNSSDEVVTCDLLEQVLSTRLTNHIREQLGASYSPFASCAVTREPKPEVVVIFHISGAPQDMPRLSTVLQADLADLRTNGPTAAEYRAGRAELDKNYGYVNNDDLIRLIEDTVDGKPKAVSEFANRARTLAGISAGALKAFAQLALPASQYIQITQLPR
jgi:zinc protease